MLLLRQPRWRNWQTQGTQNPPPQGVTVRVRPWAPNFKTLLLCLIAVFLFLRTCLLFQIYPILLPSWTNNGSVIQVNDSNRCAVAAQQIHKQTALFIQEFLCIITNSTPSQNSANNYGHHNIFINQTDVMFSLKSAITPAISSPRKQIGYHHIYIRQNKIIFKHESGKQAAARKGAING